MFTRIAAVLLALAPLTAAAKTPVTTTKVLGNFQMESGSMATVVMRRAPLQDRYRVIVPGLESWTTIGINFLFRKDGSLFSWQTHSRVAGNNAFATFRVPRNFVAVNRGSEEPILRVWVNSGEPGVAIAHAD